MNLEKKLKTFKFVSLVGLSIYIYEIIATKVQLHVGVGISHSSEMQTYSLMHQEGLNA